MAQGGDMSCGHDKTDLIRGVCWVMIDHDEYEDICGGTILPSTLEGAWQTGFAAAYDLARGWGHTDSWEDWATNPYSGEEAQR